MQEPTGTPSVHRRILAQARPLLGQILGVLALDLLAAPLSLLGPLPLKIAVDGVLGAKPLPPFLERMLPPLSTQGTLWLAAGLLIAVGLVTRLRALAAELLRERTGERLTLSFRSRLFRHAQLLSFPFHEARGVADPIYRIQYDTLSLKYLLTEGLVPFLGAAFTLASMLYVTYRVDAELAGIALIVSPVLFYLARRYRLVLRHQSRNVKKLESGALGVLHEVLGALRVVSAFGQEDREQRRFERAFDEGVQARLRMTWTEGVLGLLLGLTTAGGTAAVLVVGSRNVLAGTLTVGELLLVMGYLAELYSPLRTVSKKLASVQSHLASAERAFALLDEVPGVRERPDALRLGRVRGELALQHVSFAYENGPAPLSDVSLTIPAGSRIGIAGPTGAGKTTLVTLLMRFHDPTRGQVLLDGLDLRDLSLRDLRDQFAVVPQETVLFSTSIEENIAYARPGATHEEIVAAARAASAHDFVEALPQGYGTPVGERGMRLSGGERQRIALARAFLKDAPILVLDEPTSSLDAGTEREVVDALERLMRERTTIVIAHRETTLGACDRVYALRGGRLVARREVAS